MEGHESNLTPSEREAPAPNDAELKALEAEVAPMLGVRAGSTGSVEAGGPDSSEATMALREHLRAAFLTGQFQGDEAIEAPLEKALRGWVVPAASRATRAATLQALLDGTTANEAEGEEVRELRPVAPAPRSASQRLRLVVGVSLLAAAAAVLMILRPGLGEAGVHWSLDTATVAALEGPDPFDGLFVDGQQIASVDEMNVALATGRHIENGGQMIRIRRGSEFVLEIGAGAVVDLESTVGGASTGGQQIFIDRGSVRVATGPDFDLERPLVLLSPHVRSEVVGTIFGVDVTDSFTCVCCIEGNVHTTPISNDCGPMDVNEGRTRVLFADGGSRESDLVPHHRDSLVELRDLASGLGYWL